jgi:hypothetical protein
MGVLLLFAFAGLTCPAQAQLEPLLSRWAEASHQVTVKSTFRYFKDAELEEADHFDGWGVDFDLTVPVWKRFQLRLLVPIYTAGEAELVQGGKEIDIEGYSGTFDQPSLFLEQQFLQESNAPVNLAYYVGVGRQLAGLETTTGDVYNHKASVGLLGLKADRRLWDGKLRLVANGGIRYFWASDDVNPARTGDVYLLGEVSIAALAQPVGRIFYPVAELQWQTVELDWNAVYLVPEMIAKVHKHLELKLGVPVGLTSDSDTYNVRFQITGLF